MPFPDTKKAMVGQRWMTLPQLVSWIYFLPDEAVFWVMVMSGLLAFHRMQTWFGGDYSQLRFDLDASLHFASEEVSWRVTNWGRTGRIHTSWIKWVGLPRMRINPWRGGGKKIIQEEGRAIWRLRQQCQPRRITRHPIPHPKKAGKRGAIMDAWSVVNLPAERDRWCLVERNAFKLTPCTTVTIPMKINGGECVADPSLHPGRADPPSCYDVSRSSSVDPSPQRGQTAQGQGHAAVITAQPGSGIMYGNLCWILKTYASATRLCTFDLVFTCGITAQTCVGPSCRPQSWLKEQSTL